MNAVLLITAKAALPDMTQARRVKAQYLVTLALQSYKGEVHVRPSGVRHELPLR